MTKENNYLKELPNGYEKIYSINAKNFKTGLILNVIGAIIMLVIFVPLLLLVDISSINSDNLFQISIALLLSAVGLILYLVLHELVHGLVYKLTTGQKLTFGMSWSCAFCGVPDIFVTRKTAILALLAPFVFFSIVFIIVLVLTFSSPIIFIALSFVFSLHVGGCVGDLFVFILFIFKLKDKRILMNDTGPEQTFYAPTNN